MRLLLLWILVSTAAQAAPPEPAKFIESLSNGTVDPVKHDLVPEDFWALTAEQRLAWNQSVVPGLLPEDLNDGCEADLLRRLNGLMWMSLLQKSTDAADWKSNADAIRARLGEVEERLRRAAEQAPAKGDPRIAELERRVAVDQKVRTLEETPWSADLPPMAEEAWSSVMAVRFWAVDCDNTAWLKRQMAEIGWFDIERFGAGADKGAWLLVQHADRDKAFQREVLAMLESLPPGKTSLKNVAYLYDRVANAEGRPQKYGTQGNCQPNGAWAPNQIEDPAGVDARRKAIGLIPLGEYIAGFRNICPPPAPES